MKFRNIFASVSSSIFGTILSLIFVPFYLTMVGEERYGLIGTYLLILPVISMLDLGFGVAAIRESAKIRVGVDPLAGQNYVDLMRGMEILFLGVFALGATASVALSHAFVARWLNVTPGLEAEASGAAAMMFVALLLRWVSILYRGRVNGFEAIMWLSGFNILIATLRFGAVVPFMIATSPNLQVFFGFQLGVSIIEAVGFGWKARRLYSHSHVTFSLSRSIIRVRSIVMFTGAVSIGGLIWVSAAQFDKLILMRLMPLSTYGLYTLAVMLAGGISLLSAPINISLLPALSQLHSADDMPEFIVVYRKYIQMTAVFVCPMAATMLFFSAPIIRVWTGNPTYGAQYGSILGLYAIGNALLAVSVVAHYAMIALDRMRLYVIGIVLFAIAFVAVLLPLANRMAAQGAACAWLLVNLVYLLGWVSQVHRLLLAEMGGRWFWADFAPIAIAAAAAVAILSHIVPVSADRFTGLAELAGIGLVGLFVAVAASSFVRSQLRAVLPRR